MASMVGFYVQSLIQHSSTLQHCAAASPFPKRKQVVDALVRKGANLNEKNKE